MIDDIDIILIFINIDLNRACCSINMKIKHNLNLINTNTDIFCLRYLDALELRNN